MIEKNFKYDPDDQMMVFSKDTKNFVRVAYSDGKVWYAIADIAKLLRYKAPGKAANYRDYGVRLLRVPHTSTNVRGYTNCNCITKDALKRFIKLQSGDREVCDWILNVVIPQAEKQFEDKKEEEPQTIKREPESMKSLDTELPKIRTEEKAKTSSTELLDAIDQFIIAALSLRQELQLK